MAQQALQPVPAGAQMGGYERFDRGDAHGPRHGDGAADHGDDEAEDGGAGEQAGLERRLPPGERGPVADHRQDPATDAPAGRNAQEDADRGDLAGEQPFGALDRNLRERLLTELSALFERLGLTVVAVTHDPSEAATLADQLAVLDGGRVCQTGPPASVLDHPATAPIARLLGHTNLVPGTARDGRVATAWGTITTSDTTAGDRMVLVHPDGFVNDPDGPTTATVTGVAYRGGDPRLRLAVDRAPEVEASGWPPLAPGTTVRFRLDPPRTVLLPADTP